MNHLTSRNLRFRESLQGVLVLAGFLTAFVIVCITALILSTYKTYLPPRFEKGFLAGRESYFFQTPYFAGFYLHIFTSPVALLAGVFQFSSLLRYKLPAMHRMLGRIYVVAVLLGAAPGGFVMAFASRGGPSSVVCFIVLSSLTWFCTWQAWQTALRRDFRSHQRWMWRSYLLIASAILLRVIDPVFRHFGAPDGISYQLCVWLSWMPSLLCYEIIDRKDGR